MKSLDGGALVFVFLVIKHLAEDVGNSPVCGGWILLAWGVMCC